MEFQQSQKEISEQRDTLEKLKKYKILFFSIVLIAIALGIYIFEYFIPLISREIQLKIADAFIIAAIVTIVFEYFARRESEKKIEDILSEKIAENINKRWTQQWDELSIKLPEILILNKNVQKKILNDHTIDEILTTCLYTKLGEEVSKDVYDVIQPIIETFKPDGRGAVYDFTSITTVTLSKDKVLRDSYYNLNICNSYRRTLKKPIVKFGFTNDKNIYNRILEDPDFHYRYFLSLPTKKLPQHFKVTLKIDKLDTPREFFELNEPVSEELKGELYEIVFKDEKILDQLIGKEVMITFTIDTLIKRKAGQFYMKIVHPTKTFTGIFNSGDTPINQIDIIDNFISKAKCPEPTNIKDPNSIIKSVSIPGWIFPDSGVTFSWSEGKK